MAYAAGWYPDPQQPGKLRYFDGTTWTEHRADPQAQAQPDPAAMIDLSPLAVGIAMNNTRVSALRAFWLGAAGALVAIIVAAASNDGTHLILTGVAIVSALAMLRGIAGMWRLRGTPFALTPGVWLLTVATFLGLIGGGLAVAGSISGVTRSPGGTSADVGSCWTAESSSGWTTAVPCSDSKAAYTATRKVSTPTSCPDAYVTVSSGVLCLAPRR